MAPTETRDRVARSNEDRDVGETVRHVVEDLAIYGTFAAFNSHQTVQHVAEQAQLDTGRGREKQKLASCSLALSRPRQT
jgi:hypothetical protein